MGEFTNQNIEKYYFEQFRKHCSLPDGEVVYRDKPDVIIIGKQTLGIEITQLYFDEEDGPRSQQAQYRGMADVVSQAQSIYFSDSRKSIELHVSFNLNCPINDVKALAASLADIAKVLEYHETGSVPPRFFAHVPELDFIYCNSNKYSNVQWQVSQRFKGRNLSVVRVKKVVAKKEQKLSGYEHCDSYWLLLVVDFMDPAQDQELVWPSHAAALETSYSRVIIYKSPLYQCLEIPVIERRT
ncbi:hypothetical protein HA050_04585 [Iodobacter sp. HSC-16F04]|uniref:Uncharacterized protein n=1 Tax=Iodobacter violaceini TaxID=3044271 RepID=A0ABX0KMM8_9NEIS|nr:hypothetical protein [Iodobacter violacea]NHQ85390.1 hypothetical protein [Iodobacter violacea]